MKIETLFYFFYFVGHCSLVFISIYYIYEDCPIV